MIVDVLVKSSPLSGTVMFSLTTAKAPTTSATTRMTRTIYFIAGISSAVDEPPTILDAIVTMATSTRTTAKIGAISLTTLVASSDIMTQKATSRPISTLIHWFCPSTFVYNKIA